MKNRSLVLLHPFFIINLVALLVNDIYLKYDYPGWVTGKLSDFTGLAVFALFVLVGLKNKKLVMLSCTLFFIWWKSPLSQPVIDLLNIRFNLPVQRVIDYSDLFALSVLPCIYFVRPVNYSFTLKRLAVNLVGLLCLFSFCFTTVPYRSLYSNREDEVRFLESFNTRLTEEQILEKFYRTGFSYYKENERYFPVHETELFYKIQKGDSSYYTRVPRSNDSSVFIRQQSSEFYVLPLFVINGDSLRNVEIIITDEIQKNKRRVHVYSFRLESSKRYQFYNSKKSKEYRKFFKSFFEK